jgi:transposase
MYKAGYNYREIASILSISKQAAYKWVGDLGDGVIVQIDEWIYDRPCFTYLADRNR